MGIAISPLPIAAIIAILLSRQARLNGIAYTATSIVVTFGFTIVAALSTSSAGSASKNGDDTVVLVLGIVLSLAFLGLAIGSWVSRPKDGAEAKVPSWLSAIDLMSARKAAGLALIMGITNGKNIPLEIKAGAHIGAADLGVGPMLLVAAIFAFAASLGLVLPTLLAATGSAKIESGLRRMKAELIAHNAVIMTVVFAMLFAIQAANVIQTLLH